jgi:hypothetical protein
MSSTRRGQTTTPRPPSPPPTPLPSADNSDEENEDSADNIIDAAMDAKFMDDTEQEAEEERAAHAAFDVDQ